ncbi:chlorohydrolase [candidate division LCP-89 bacterium B3_LCP]|uniref:Chlorohydrolase n=1 Tax=candidate division LCP-89 bacterium B3_LCP TaxID=2012998 RepID=A0A532URQ5_UNCL8|nr:MAG: chlorohydrolase [candidate division LCP-89 bacterium B3_LCP]
MAESLLIKYGTIITLGDNLCVLKDHALLTEDGLIKKIGRNNDFTDTYDRVIDASGKVVMPGMINAHMHFYSTFARGLSKAKPARNFNEVLQNLWWRLDKVLTLDDCYISALIILIEAIKNGTTTLIDHHASPGAVAGSLEKIAQAVRQTGLRACLCYETSDRDGEEIARQGLQENTGFIRRSNEGQDDHIRALFGLHAAFTLSDATLKEASRLGCDLKAGFHLHVAEALSDQQYSEDNFNMRVVERLHKFGILGPQSIAAHCVHLNDHERQILAETDTTVVHNPQSNLNNAVGIMDLMKLSGSGIRVGLGTDAMTVNMTEELRTALWAQHLLQKNPTIGFQQVTSTLFQNNPTIASRIWGFNIGNIAEGYAADLILKKYLPPTPLDDDSVLGHIVYGLSQVPVDTTIVAGSVLMEDRKLLINVDEAEIAAEARSLTQSLWDRF